MPLSPRPTTNVSPRFRAHAQERSSFVWALSLGLALALINGLVWAWLHASPWVLPNVDGLVPGMAYNGYSRWQSPIQGERPSAGQVASDLQLLRSYTPRLRTYTTTESPELFAEAAAQGFEVSAGLWLSNDMRRNEAELLAAIQIEKAFPGVVRQWIVGNETQLKGMVSPSALRAALRQARAELRAPVSTAEPWHIWEANPGLAREVDFIAVHLLPYWEGASLEGAAGLALQRFSALQRRYPNHRVVIAEIGWPSGGGRFGGAEASPEGQARFVREVLSAWKLLQNPPELYLMEAVDQPWKGKTDEGPVGAHWGMFDAARNPKFALTGDPRHDQSWVGRALAASLLGGLCSVLFVRSRSGVGRDGEIAMGSAILVAASLVVAFVTVPLINYPSLLDWLVLLGLLPPLALMVMVVLGQLHEFLASRHLPRLQPCMPGALVSAPKAFTTGLPPGVSVHMACANEDPAMVIEGVKSLLAMRYPRFEVVVVDNNTHNRKASQALQDQCEALQDARLRFVSVAQLEGFKAGALNLALAQTSEWADWVAVVDADYVVNEHWLAHAFGSPLPSDVALIQYPQAHRLDAVEHGSWLARGMDTEMESFFASGMQHRQSHEAALQHGTMCLVRKDALVKVGGWSSQTLCEDSELGLRLLQAGCRADYRPQVMGVGRLPPTYAAYARQRGRWARGAMQILWLHAAGRGAGLGLLPAQAYHFYMGWAPWLADGLHTLFAMTAALWTVALVWQGGDAQGPLGLPLEAFWVPLAVFWMLRLTIGPWQMRLAQPHRPWRDIVSASALGMALTPTIGVSVLSGLWAAARGRSLVFQGTRTDLGTSGVVKSIGRLVSWLVGPTLLAMACGFLWAVQEGALSYPWSSAMAWAALLAALGLPYAVASAVRLCSGGVSEKGALGQPSSIEAR